MYSSDWFKIEIGGRTPRFFGHGFLYMFPSIQWGKSPIDRLPQRLIRDFAQEAVADGLPVQVTGQSGKVWGRNSHVLPLLMWM